MGSFFALAEASERNCLVICDRGTMDASAFVSKQEWDEILQRNMCDEVDIRDNRYHQVVHMVTSAKGAEQYYTIDTTQPDWRAWKRLGNVTRRQRRPGLDIRMS